MLRWVAETSLIFSRTFGGRSFANTVIGLPTFTWLGRQSAATGRWSSFWGVRNGTLAIAEEALGPDHPSVATSLNNLAELYDTQGDYAKAEPLYKRSLAITEEALGPDHPDVATSLENLAGLYRATNRSSDAEPLERRAARIRVIKR